MTNADADYLLGTHDEELVRLGLQHRVWRPRALDAWRRAGFTVGQTLLDIGCGPGYAAMDLAEIVGPRGRVIGFERSQRYLRALEHERDRRGLVQLTAFERDLDADTSALPVEQADGAWARWVFAFLTKPREMVARVAEAIRPGGTVVIHEYADYGTWQLAPHLPELAEFVQIVIDSWRETGANPDIGLELPRWLAELDFEIVELRPLVDVVTPANFVWQWPRQFLAVGLDRFVELGRLTKVRAAEIEAAFDAAEAAPNTWMITPIVLEIVARKRA